MGYLTAKKSNQLSDGRVIRALDGTFTQAQMFSLKRRIPANETIMGIKDHDDSLIISNAWKAIRTEANPWWRTDRYGAYARGFEEVFAKQVGATLVWIDKGVDQAFEVPDVPHPLDKNKGLRQATGMLDFALDKLQYDDGKRLVSVTSDFNPETDVIVRDIMRPRGWALVDADGYPLRSKPSDEKNADARFSRIRHAYEFEDNATGWHGSISRAAYVDKYKWYVIAFQRWPYESQVGLVGAPLPKMEISRSNEDNSLLIKGITLEDVRALTHASIAEVEDLLRTVRPEALEATIKLLQAFQIKE